MCNLKSISKKLFSEPIRRKKQFVFGYYYVLPKRLRENAEVAFVRLFRKTKTKKIQQSKIRMKKEFGKRKIQKKINKFVIFVYGIGI